MKPFGSFLVYAIWIGAGLAIAFIAAPAAFSAATSRSAAADIVGVMLSRWHYIALAAPMLLLAGEFRARLANTRAVVLLSFALLLGSAQVFADLEIRRIRASSLISISELPLKHATRRRFGLMHGLSTTLMLLQLAAAIGAAAPGRDGDADADEQTLPPAVPPPADLPPDDNLPDL